MISLSLIRCPWYLRSMLHLTGQLPVLALLLLPNLAVVKRLSALSAPVHHHLCTTELSVSDLTRVGRLTQLTHGLRRLQRCDRSHEWTAVLMG